MKHTNLKKYTEHTYKQLLIHSFVTIANREEIFCGTCPTMVAMWLAAVVLAITFQNSRGCEVLKLMKALKCKTLGASVMYIVYS